MSRPWDALHAHRNAMDGLELCGDVEGKPCAATNIGAALDDLGRPEEALAMHADARSMFAELGVERGIASCDLGLAPDDVGAYDQADIDLNVAGGASDAGARAALLENLADARPRGRSSAPRTAGLSAAAHR